MLFKGFPNIRLLPEQARMTHDAYRNVVFLYVFSSSGALLSDQLISKRDFPSVPTSAATKSKGKTIALMMMSQLSSIPLLGEAALLLKQAAGKILRQDFFVLLKQLGL